MKENEKKKIYFNSTFNNFNIKRETIDITSKLDDMNIKEYNDIKLIATCFLPPYLKNNKDLLLNYNITKALSTKNIKSPKKYKIRKKKLFSDFKKNKSNFTREMLLSFNKNNRNNNKEKINKSQRKLSKDTLYKTLSEGKSEKEIEFKKEKTKYLIRNKTSSLSNLFIKNKPFVNLMENNFRKYHTNKNNNESKRTSSINNKSKSSNIKHYLTTDNFSTLPSVKNEKINNNRIYNYSYKTNTNKFNSTMTSKSFKIKNRNCKILNKINTNFLDSRNDDDSIEEKKRKLKNLYTKKKIPRINLSYWQLKKLENSLYAEYNNNYIDMVNKDKIIRKIKEKCQYILKELDKKNNMEIQEIIKEINDQLLGVGFKDFYRYLLTILKNYDKKIVDYAYDIIENKKECPEELKLKNVEKRHQKFMGILERQFASGLNAHKKLDYYINKSKNKMESNNNNFGNEKNNFYNNDNNNRNNIIDNIFNKNSYRSKFFDLFKK